MHVLVSYKTTNLDIYGESIRRKIAGGLLDSSHLARLQDDHWQHHRSLQRVLEELGRHSISFVEVSRGLFWPDLAGVDAIITLGGDGTVLEASRHIIDEQIPVLGVCSSNMSVGYLCACGYEGIPWLIQGVVRNSVATRKLARLKARIRSGSSGTVMTTEPVLNDFLYTNQNPAATTIYRLGLGKAKETQKSSGIWVSTPAGSTAAIAAAGGTPAPLTSTDFQFMVREPYTPPDARGYRIPKGFFNPDCQPLVIENRSNRALLAQDGRRGHVSLGFGDTITFVRAGPLNLCHRNQEAGRAG